MMPPRLGIFGAGSIGCYIGGLLIQAGHDIVLLGRKRIGDELLTTGLRLTDFRARDTRVAAKDIRFHLDPAALADCDFVLVTVKSQATAETAQMLAPVLNAGATVLSLQNGVRNATVLRQGLPNTRVLAGMVPFNVLHAAAGHFHQGTSGAILIEEAGLPSRNLLDILGSTGLEVQAHPHMQAVQWGKLLINLNNAINALSGLPLVEQLRQRAYRRVLAACIDEGYRCLQRQGISPYPPAGVPLRLLPSILRTPDWLFQRIAKRMLSIDANARSSMWEDLQRRRLTEVDWLNGEIVKLGQELGLPCPVNARITSLVHEAETRAQGSPRLEAERLLMP